MKRAIARHRDGPVPHLAAVVLVATACGWTGTLANAQSNDLIAAAGRGDLPTVNALLRSGVDVNDAKNTVSGPTTALMEASSNGHLEVVQALLAAKADVNAKRGRNSKEGDTALTLASLNGHLNVVQTLLAAKADVNGGSPPALYDAATLGNLDMVRVLVAAKPDLDWQDPLIGATALMQALAPFRLYILSQVDTPGGHWDIARLLVEAGANVNATTKAGVTALKLVAQESSPRSLAMVQALLAAHAEVNVGAGGGTKALNPATPGYGAATGYTALGLAASTGSVEVVQALLANSWADVNAKQHDGKTPLMNASANGRADVVRLLLAEKTDVNAVDNDGKTALTLALQNGHAEVAKLLTSTTAALPGQK